MITDVLYFIDTDVFVKIMFFFTLEVQEAVEQYLLNVLFIVVINCFWILGSVNCTAFRKIMYHFNLVKVIAFRLDLSPKVWCTFSNAILTLGLII